MAEELRASETLPSKLHAYARSLPTSKDLGVLWIEEINDHNFGAR